MIITIILLSILVMILGYTTYNLLRKNEKQRRYPRRLSRLFR